MRKGLLAVAATLLATGLAPVQAGDPPPASDLPLADLGPPSLLAPLPAGGPPAPSSECFYASAEYLLWWVRDVRLPPLITAGSAADPRPAALGQTGTTVLSPDRVDTDSHSGGRFGAGYWLTLDHSLGVDGSFFFLGQRSTSFGAGSQATRVLGRPFFDAATGIEKAGLTSFPGTERGFINDRVSSQLWGYDLNVQSQVLTGPGYRASLLAGFRSLQLSEGYRGERISEFNPPAPGFRSTDQDAVMSFAARNCFYGGQVGARADCALGAFSLSGWGKLALGSNHEIGNVGGSFYSTGPAGTVLVPFGGLALPSINGRHVRDVFAVVPELGVTVGYNITPYLRATFGYSFLYLSDAMRPGEMIDRAVTPSTVPPPLGGTGPPGPVRPIFPDKGTEFWAQGLSFGLQLRF
jgi:hypothetical protein